jgi:hypothetical protein
MEGKKRDEGKKGNKIRKKPNRSKSLMKGANVPSFFLSFSLLGAGRERKSRKRERKRER